MKFRWLLLSVLSAFLFSSPAEAGRLVFWRFDSNQNRLVFSTDEGVQPSAQLIPNPTRLVIDLPGTDLGRPTVNQRLGNIIRNLRVGQFAPGVTRLVIELAPGYTVDPQQIKVRGASPTQWSVDLPTPQRIVIPPSNPQQNNQSSTPNPPTSNNSNSGFQYLRVTQNGLFVRLDGRNVGKIRSRRSRDRRRIDFEIEGVTLPRDLAAQTLSVNRYGVSQVQFAQTSASPAKALISLNVGQDSPDWQASVSRFGGLVLVPKGGINVSSTRNPNPPSNPSSSKQATINAVELANNDTQLLIRADRRIAARGTWNRREGAYEIRISNAKLAEPIRGPELDTNSPVSRLRIRQENSRTVLILVQSAPGIQIGELNQPSSELLSLQLQRPIKVDLPPRGNQTGNPQIPQNVIPNNRILVAIDPGHGGKDPGAIGIGGVQEKNIILPISQQVAQLLQQRGVQVKLTRASDFFVSLDGRAQIANRAGANLFVSIHANAISLSRPDVNGLETYYYQSGQRLAQTIHRSILRRVNIRDRGVRRARFFVLRKTTMPSVLVEVGFLTGNEDSANLRNPNYRRQMAEAIANGILEYIQQNRL